VIQTNDVAQRLNELRAAALHAVASLEEETREALATRDVSDLLDDDGASEVDVEDSLHLQAQAEARAQAIDEALQRVEDGSYGTCITCGSSISGERLDALPATPYCVTCAGRHNH